MAQRKGFFSRLAGMNPLSADNPFRHVGAAMADIYGQMRGQPKNLATPGKPKPRKGALGDYGPGKSMKQKVPADARWRKEPPNVTKARKSFSTEEQDQMGLNG